MTEKNHWKNNFYTSEISTNKLVFFNRKNTVVGITASIEQEVILLHLVKKQINSNMLYRHKYSCFIPTPQVSPTVLKNRNNLF